MSFGRAVKSCYAKYATFRGRAPRSEYWFFHLFFFVIFYALAFTGVFVAGPDDNPATPAYTAIGWLMGLFAAGSILPILAVSVRRIHDTGASGWFILTWIVGVVGLVWACIPGTPGPNKYGPSPFQTTTGAIN